MNDGQLILITGALLAGGPGRLLRGRAPARARRWCFSSASGWLVGSDGTAGSTSTTTSSPARSGIIALALILFEGGLATGFDEIRPVLRPALSLAFLGTLGTAVDRRPRRRLALSFLDARGPAARLDPRRHRRRRDLRGAARLDARAAAGAHARGRGGPERPGRGAARDRLHRLDPEARLRPRRHARALRRSSSGSALSSGSWSGALGVQAFRRAQMASSGLYPVASLAIAALAFGAADVAARLRLPRRLPRRAQPRKRADPRPPHDRGLPRRARLDRPDRDVLRARPAGLSRAARRGRARGHGARARARVRRAAGRGVRRDGVRAVHASPRSSRSAGRGCAAPCPSCSRPSR